MGGGVFRRGLRFIYGFFGYFWFWDFVIVFFLIVVKRRDFKFENNFVIG